MLATISDKKKGVADVSNSSLIDHYLADVVSAQDYYPFGMLMPGRSYSGSSYRYGFNGKENDNDVKGEGNQIDYGMRILDTRIGRFLSVDPLTKQYPHYTPYQFSGNTPIQAIDLDGEEEFHYTMTMDKHGKALLTKVSSRIFNTFSLFGFTWKTVIPVKRFMVDYEGKTYYIGYPQYGTGYANAWKAEDFENDYIKKQGDAIDFEYDYVDADHSRAGSAAAYVVGAQNASAETAIPMGETPSKATNKTSAGAHSGNKGSAKANAGASYENHGVEFLETETMANSKANTFDRSRVDIQIAKGKQDVHYPESKNYQANVRDNKRYKSVLTTNAQALLNDFHNGSGTIIKVNEKEKSLLIRFNRPIGDVINEKTGAVITKGSYYGAIKYGEKNAHITPVNYTP